MILPKKLAIFVEGQTEQIFVERLVKEIAGYKKLSIEIYEFQGSKGNRKIQQTKSSINLNTPFFVLLYNCGNDSHVISDMKKEYKSLTANGYDKIIGLRDLYPKSLPEKDQMEKSIRALLKPLQKNGIPLIVNLAIMEIEAWFLAEWHYFERLDPRLTPDFIAQNFGFDLRIIDIEERPHPSEDLENIYRLINRNYDKSKDTVKQIVDYLDYEFLYLHLIKTVKNLHSFIQEIDTFLVEKKS